MTASAFRPVSAGTTDCVGDVGHYGRRTASPRVRKTTLENGIRVVSEAMPEVRSIALGIIVDVGPQDESAGKEGLAHLTEHMVFQGTRTRNARQIGELMDLAGGQFSGFTTRDYTCYHAHVLDEHCTYALELFGDMLLNATVPVDALEREQEAIRREISAGVDSPSERVHDLLKGAAWPNHPLGHRIAGSSETLERLTRDDIVGFLRAQYTPNRLIVAAAGRLDHDDLVSQVWDGFWPLHSEGPPRLRPPALHRSGVALETAPVSQAYFALGVPAPVYAHADRYAFHLLANLLGGSISSRLFRRLREERGLLYHVNSEYHAYRNGGMLVVEGAAAPERLPEVLHATLVELWGLTNGTQPVDDDEAWKAQTQLRRQHLLASEDTNTRMSRLATQELYFDRHVPAAEVLANIEGVDASMLRRLASGPLAAALRQTTLAVVAPNAQEYWDRAALEALLAEFGEAH